MRFNRSSFRMLSILSKKEMYRKILMTNLNLSSVEAEQILDTNLSDTNRYNVLNNPRHRIINNCLIFRKFNVDVKPLESLKFCLGLKSFKLEHRINILKDMGVQELNVSIVTKIVKILNNPVLKFKGLTNIPAEQNISENIFGTLEELPMDNFQLKLSNDQLKARKYYDTCLLHCKTQIFNLPFLDDKLFLTGWDMRCKSISMIAETLKILRLDLNYNDEFIKKYPYVITASADNIRSLLNNFKDTGICGIPIVKVLKRYTFILFVNADNVKQLLVSFQRYQIPDEYVKKFMRILIIDNDIFIERMEAIRKHPDLHLWHNYPRILQLIYQKGMVYDRIGYLRLLNRMKWARLQTVLTGKSFMEKYIQYGASTLASKKCLKYVLANELESDKVTNLIKMLTRHPYWKTAGFVDIEQMLKYLKMNFTISEICQNIHIILYAQPVVEKLLTDLRQRYSQSTEFSFTNSQYLALCLYTLEKDNHFTGDSIWSNGHNTKQHSSQSSSSLEDDVTDDSDTSTTEDADSDTDDEDKTPNTTTK